MGSQNLLHIEFTFSIVSDSMATYKDEDEDDVTSIINKKKGRVYWLVWDLDSDEDNALTNVVKDSSADEYAQSVDVLITMQNDLEKRISEPVTDRKKAVRKVNQTGQDENKDETWLLIIKLATSFLAIC